MYILGQAIISARLMERFQPASVRSVVVCTKGDAVLEPMAKEYGIDVIIYPKANEHHSTLPKDLQRFIAEQAWIFAKTYAATWPHEYIVEERVDGALFGRLANHIDTCGYTDYFYSKPMVYFDYEGYTYWHMQNIINRCVVADTYHRRKQDGRLPPASSPPSNPIPPPTSNPSKTRSTTSSTSSTTSPPKRLESWRVAGWQGDRFRVKGYAHAISSGLPTSLIVRLGTVCV